MKADTPTLVLRNGRIWSPTAPSGFAASMAISGARIVAIGDDAEVAELCAPQTEVLDLAGRLAIPAFGDAHIHAIGGGLESLRCDLLGVRGRHAIIETVAAWADGLPPGAWVTGGGWEMAAFPGGTPTKEDLDAVTGGRPAFLPNRDHHSAWVNSVALDMAGIDELTPDPADGRIERDKDGSPTGCLHDGAMALVARLLGRPSADELAAGLRAALAKLHSLGITHFQDACVGSAAELGLMDTFDAYVAAANEGWLTAQVRGALWWDRRRGVEQIDDLLTRREAASSGAFRATSAKVMMDGVCETFTAAMGSPYLGEPGCGGAHRGELFISPEEAAAAVAVLDDEDFQVHFHAIGDRAVSTALDAIEALPAERRHVGRHHLAHLQFISPRDLGRFRRLGVVANFQPLWAANDPQMQELTIPFVGPERADWQYSIGSVAAAGGHVAFGSDWPVSSPDPLQEIHVAVNRVRSARAGEPGTPECEMPFRPSEAMSVAASLAAFTSGVAFVNGTEDSLGTLAEGYRADVAVLDQDLFEIAPSGIGDTSVEMTIAGGRVVHGA